MSSYNKVKGNKFEKEILNQLRSHNIQAQRVVASGSVHEDDGDIIMNLDGVSYNIECKFHKTIPNKGMEKWIQDNDILVMKENREPPKVYMDFDTLLKLLKVQREK